MTRIHLMHCVPHPRMHGLYGYSEVIESFYWGLKELNCDVSTSINTYASDAINIIFGSQVLPVDVLKSLPRNSLVYNMEVYSEISLNEVSASVVYCATNFQIIDYSVHNFNFWNSLGTKNVSYLPIGYTPNLTRIPKIDQEDIDILIYGTTSNDRLFAFHELSMGGFKVAFLSGFYGADRDHMIGRSKLILNVNNNPIFEIVRTSYLFANQKAVICSFSEKCHIDDDLKGAFSHTNLDELVSNCQKLLEDSSKRKELEKIGFEVIKKRNFVESLSLNMKQFF